MNEEDAAPGGQPSEDGDPVLSAASIGERPDDEQISDAEVTDQLPDDLDASGHVGPYLFPNNNRRRIPGVLYLVIATICAVLWATKADDAALINDGYLAAAIGLALLGLYHLQAGWNLAYDEQEALVAATGAVGFAVGHASAAMAWRGIRSRPTWRVLVYSGEDPPDQRGLVLVDGVDGAVIAKFVEANPEDWDEDQP
ncbi:MAG: hypothetical protein IH940_00855 [Acidobacteria bacterium]|nr:hypothetical protein [Acidobacteriota bacterium]